MKNNFDSVFNDLLYLMEYFIDFVANGDKSYLEHNDLQLLSHYSTATMGVNYKMFNDHLMVMSTEIPNSSRPSLNTSVQGAALVTVIGSHIFISSTETESIKHILYDKDTDTTINLDDLSDEMLFQYSTICRPEVMLALNLAKSLKKTIPVLRCISLDTKSIRNTPNMYHHARRQLPR